jgi:hypothetical protein
MRRIDGLEFGNKLNHQAKMIIVSSEINISKIEVLLNQLPAFNSKNYVDLKLPTNVKFVGFGALLSLFQLMITWRRLKNCGRLIIGNTEVNEDDLQEFTKKYYGFIASVLAWEVGVINFNGVDLKASIRAHNSRLMKLYQSSNFDDVARGDSILFPCFDHIESSLGLLPSLYYDGSLRDETNFATISEALIDITFKNNQSIKNYFIEISSHLNSILYELFDNTNKWAKHSFTGKTLKPSVRGIYGRLYKIEWNSISGYANSEGLIKYFDSIRKIMNPFDSRFMTFLEISVYDSGPGFAQKYSKKPLDEMSLSEEYNYVIECLRKHNTSHTEIGIAQHTGLGLFTIMDLLSSNFGYLSIRTGRLNLYRDFLGIPFENQKSKLYNYALLDTKSSSGVIEYHPRVDGTFVTLIIPQQKK